MKNISYRKYRLQNYRVPCGYSEKLHKIVFQQFLLILRAFNS